MAAAADASFAQGMHAALWPKVAQCHAHEAQQADESSLVGYAERLRAFPERVARVQKKLQAIEDRLLAMKEARNRSVAKPTVTPEEALLF
ncbi:hypothetical protein PybrP1_003348 [[Pythium] brassicae (nom. inval.)]|nr:hypothetical protein PybrP1_003348 [[Pythium] brassicae (nom. inval.)]